MKFSFLFCCCALLCSLSAKGQPQCGSLECYVDAFVSRHAYFVDSLETGDRVEAFAELHWDGWIQGEFTTKVLPDARKPYLVKYEVEGVSHTEWVAEVRDIGGGKMEARNTYTSPFLTGTIPTAIGELTFLDYLSVDSTELVGAIPKEIGALTMLTYLRFHGARDYGLPALTGQIPKEIGDLSKLTSLNLAKNKLAGPIPPALLNLPELRSLYLHVNKLTGTLPKEVGGVSLFSLDLSENKLVGPIPSALGNLEKIDTLKLYKNELTGTIPSALGNLKKIDRLYLNDNQLTGTIPETFGNLGSVWQIKLHDNKLEGCVPTCMDFCGVGEFNGAPCRFTDGGTNPGITGYCTEECASCFDDTDCGPGLVCHEYMCRSPISGPGGVCGTDSDCTNNLCDVNVYRCASCFDEYPNGDETDVDCGGGTCDGCADGQGCGIDTDCGPGLVCHDYMCRYPWTVPTHRWALDEAAGATDAADTGTSVAPKALALTGSSAVFLGPEAGGGAALPNVGSGFNVGPRNFLDVGGGSGLSFAATGGVTFAVWVKIDSFQNSGGAILTLWDSTGANSILLYHYGTTRRATVEIKNKWTGETGSYNALTTPDCNAVSGGKHGVEGTPLPCADAEDEANGGIDKDPEEIVKDHAKRKFMDAMKTCNTDGIYDSVECIKQAEAAYKKAISDSELSDGKVPCDFFFPVAGSRWVHVALTVTAEGTWSLYRDGTTQCDWQWDIAATGGVAANTDMIPYTQAALGRNDALWGCCYLDGTLRDARLYDTALDAADVAALFEATRRPVDGCPTREKSTGAEIK